MSAIHLTTTVLPGRKVEVPTPELAEGQAVEVTIVTRESPNRDVQAFLNWLDALPPGPRSADTWEEIERNYQAERDSWDR